MWLEPIGVPVASNSSVTWRMPSLSNSSRRAKASTEAASPPVLSRMIRDSRIVLPLV